MALRVVLCFWVVVTRFGTGAKEIFHILEHSVTARTQVGNHRPHYLFKEPRGYG
jgi:hypothetical protein